MESKWLTLQEIADELQVHYSTVLRWVTTKDEARKLRAYRVGAQYRVKREDLEHWIERGAGQEPPKQEAPAIRLEPSVA